jgi:hypothetical protein
MGRTGGPGAPVLAALDGGLVIGLHPVVGDVVRGDQSGAGD